jgi:rhodanese-related sulfurtransferase
MAPAELRRRLVAGEPVALLDVREDDERAWCAIAVPPPSTDLHVPMGEVQDRLDEILRAAADRPLVVYCHHGIRSLAVARWVASRGPIEVHNLDGGIDAWSAEVDPGMPRY